MKIRNIILGLLALVLASCQTDVSEDFASATVSTIGVNRIWAKQATAVAKVIVHNGGSISEKGFILAEAEGYDVSGGQHLVSTYELSDGGRYELLLEDLKPETAYVIVASVIDNLGREIKGAETRFVTAEDRTPAIGGQKIVSVTAKSAVLEAKILDDCGTLAEMFGVEYKKEGEESVELYTIPGAPEYLVRQGEAFQIVIPSSFGFQPETAYDVRLYAGINGQDVYTSGMTLHMLSVVLPEVKTPSAIDGTIGKTDFTISPALLSDGNDPEVVFGIAYLKNANAGVTPDDNWNRVQAASLNPEGGNYSVYVSGLEVASSYGVAAYATNDMGTVYGDVLIVETESAAAPVFSTVSYPVSEYQNKVGEAGDFNVGDDYIWLKADFESDGGNVIKSVGFKFADNPEFTGSEDIKATVDGEAFIAKKEGLTDGTVYYYRAYVETEALGVIEGKVASARTAVVFAKEGERLYQLKLGTPGNATTPATLVENPDKPLYYYELPAVEVEVEGVKYNYCFLDRNLGASLAPGKDQIEASVMTVDMREYVGYYFQLGCKVPGASTDAPLTNIASSYGWNGSHTSSGWTDVTDDPCPKGYRMPTKAEMNACFAALDSNSGRFRGSINACPTGFRQKQGGCGNNVGQICFYTTTGVYTLDGETEKFSTTALQGAPVRCVRIETVE